MANDFSTESYGCIVTLGNICYISKGMVLHSNERHYPNEFTKDDLISAEQDESHPVPYIEGDSIKAYELSKLKYLSYGEELRAPARVSRPTFPELYNRPKLMRGETSYAWIDDGHTMGNEWVYSNHSVFIFTPWYDLRGVDNRSIEKAVRNEDVDRAILEETSQYFQLEFLLAILNSPKAEEILKTVTTSARASRFQPEDFKQLPIPFADHDEQSQIAEKVRQLLSLGREFLAKRLEGWKINTAKEAVVAPPTLSLYPSIRKLPLRQAKLGWSMVIDDPTAHLYSAYMKNGAFYRKSKQVVHFNETITDDALTWLERQFGAAAEDVSFQAAEADNLEIPATPADAVKALGLLLNAEKQTLEDVLEFNKVRKEVDDLVAALYEERIDK